MDSTVAIDGAKSDRPSRYRYFPGWTMVGISAMAQYMSAPGQSYSVAAFKEPMRQSLVVSETSYSLAYAFATIISGALLPFVGRLIDWVGVRRTLPPISLMLCFGCLAMSQISNLTQLYLGFSLVRSLGQGALSLVAACLVCEWFERKRGIATAISGLGGSLSVMTIPLLNIWVIHTYDWQTAWVVLGVAAAVLLFVPSLILVRDCPEELGMLPDGASSQQQTEEGSARQQRSAPLIQRDNWTVSDAIRDVTFWKLLSVPATSGMVGTGLVFHAVSLLGSRGVSPAWAVGLISFQATVATLAALGAGMLTDRYPARYLLAAAMVLLASAGITVLILPHPLIAVAYAAMLGLHGSILRSTGTVVWINYYGRENQGAIRGVAMAVMVFAAAVGPLPLALSIDWFQSYDYALALFIAVPSITAACVWTAKPPGKL